jgi:AraC-like DNA-binding protein
MDQVIPFLQSLIIAQCGLFLAFLSFNARAKVLSNRILGIFISVLALHMLLNLFNQHLLIGFLPNLGVGLGLCYGPILFFYSKALAYRDFKFTPIHFVHTVPFFVALLLVVFTRLDILIFAIAIFSSLLVYSFAIVKMLHRYRYILSQIRSDYEQITLNWMSYLLALQFTLLGLNITSVTLYMSGFLFLGQLTEIFLFVGLWVFVSLGIYQGLQHPQLFSGVTDEDKQIVATVGDAQKLPDELLDDLMEQIEAYMTEKKPFLMAGLTVKDLGNQLSLNPRYISQAINAKAGKNFSEYVNVYKVKHACQLLSSRELLNLTIIDVMLQSGFNTKSNFNRAFKSETGLTPFEYKQKSQEAI